MPIPLFNSIASWLLKKRYHQIELFLKYPEEVQDEVLHQLLSIAEDTEIGRKYDFESISSYETFVERVPIVCYEEIEPMIERSRRGEQNIYWPTTIKWFAKSSGTTNAKSKFIPVSSEALEDCHYKSSKDLLCLYLNNNENSQLFTGKSLRLGGSKELYQDNGTFFGDLSAILIDNMPFWAELSSTPSNKVSLMSEWESKLQAIIKESVQENVTSLAGVPSWMLVLLMLDYGIFYEFIPMETYGTAEQITLPLWKVKVNKNYAVVITTNAGLWRYRIGDTVRFTSVDPYRIKITGRTKHHINVFGEELIIENAEEALKSICKKTGSEIMDYTVAPIFMEGKEKGAHEWIIEFRKPPQELAYFTEFLDNALKSLNSDYEAKRYNNITLKPPKVHIARENLFYDWLKSKDKLGGQHKIPRLSNKRDYIEELLHMNK